VTIVGLRRLLFTSFYRDKWSNHFGWWSTVSH
jgi:hypothetical protein